MVAPSSAASSSCWWRGCHEENVSQARQDRALNFEHWAFFERPGPPLKKFHVLPSGGGEPGRPSARLTGTMSIEGGTAIVLAYLLVSIGVIVAFVGAVFMAGWFIGRRHEHRRGRRAEE